MPELFPKGLLNWAGQRSGGVRRLLDDDSGRPAGKVIGTPLLDRVERWARGLVSSSATTPRVLLLVGGPGNGKTEAVEAAISALDSEAGLSGGLERQLTATFNPVDGSAVPRLASVSIPPLPGGASRVLHLVQDASSPDPLRGSTRPSLLLLEELESHALLPTGDAYLACVNRGILDEALMAARDGRRTGVTRILEATTQAASLLAEPVSCWPLDGFPWIAVWPMDVESLVSTPAAGASPAAQLLERALAPESWTPRGACPAGALCPHCLSKDLLTHPATRENLLHLLHWFELASGKRWTFRDLNSLLSHLLAGSQVGGGDASDPCAWAAAQAAARAEAGPRAKVRRQLAPFLLVAAQYQHALFPSWNGSMARAHSRHLKLLLEGDPNRLKSLDTIEGLIRFISDGRASSIPATLSRVLPDLCTTLDPALASPEVIFYEGDRGPPKRLHNLDVRFSQSVDAGLQFVRPHRWLTECEVDLLRRLAEADQELSLGEVRRRAPAAAGRLQLLLRDFSCRLVRRSIGVRLGIAKDADLLSSFEGVARGDEGKLHAAVKQVEVLLNRQNQFELCLNTTFGEPLPPKEHRAVLKTQKQRVKPRRASQLERPASMTKFMTVGLGDASHSVPLTFGLYRAVAELKAGLLPASLPREVVALLDATKAKLAGLVVRNPDALEDAEITLGEARETVEVTSNTFVVRPGGAL